MCSVKLKFAVEFTAEKKNKKTKTFLTFGKCRQENELFRFVYLFDMVQ